MSAPIGLGAVPGCGPLSAPLRLLLNRPANVARTDRMGVVPRWRRSTRLGTGFRTSTVRKLRCTMGPERRARDHYSIPTAPGALPVALADRGMGSHPGRLNGLQPTAELSKSADRPRAGVSRRDWPDGDWGGAEPLPAVYPPAPLAFTGPVVAFLTSSLPASTVREFTIATGVGQGGGGGRPWQTVPCREKPWGHGGSMLILDRG